MGTNENTKALTTSDTDVCSPESCLMPQLKVRYTPEKIAENRTTPSVLTAATGLTPTADAAGNAAIWISTHVGVSWKPSNVTVASANTTKTAVAVDIRPGFTRPTA